jgi:uncharacterized cupin superfamily protein
MFGGFSGIDSRADQGSSHEATADFRNLSALFQDSPRTSPGHCGSRADGTSTQEISMSAVLSSVAQPRFADKLHIPKATLESWALSPDLVISGQPKASGTVFSKSADGRCMRGIWDCTPGSFHWRWTDDETIVVVSGRATVDMADGRRIELNPGDLAFFEKGQASVWTIHENFRKGFHTMAPQAVNLP